VQAGRASRPFTEYSQNSRSSVENGHSSPLQGAGNGHSSAEDRSNRNGGHLANPAGSNLGNTGDILGVGPLHSSQLQSSSSNVNAVSAVGPTRESNNGGSSNNKNALAQQLLDHLLGQYYKKSKKFRALLSAASCEGTTTDVVWIQWWPDLEREVRLAIKPEMKAVYDSR